MLAILRASLVLIKIVGNIEAVIQNLDIMTTSFKKNNSIITKALMLGLATTTTTTRTDILKKTVELTTEDLVKAKVFSNNLNWETVTKVKAKKKMVVNKIIVVEMMARTSIRTVINKVKVAITVVDKGMDNLPRGTTIISLLKIRGPITPTTEAQCSFLKSKKESLFLRSAEVVATIPRPAVTSKCASAKKNKSSTNNNHSEEVWALASTIPRNGTKNIVILKRSHRLLTRMV